MVGTFYKASTSGKSAWIGVKIPFTFGNQLVVVPMSDVEAVKPNPEKGDTFTIPDTLERVPLLVWDEETEDNIPAVTSDGEAMYTLAQKA